MKKYCLAVFLFIIFTGFIFAKTTGGILVVQNNEDFSSSFLNISDSWEFYWNKFIDPVVFASSEKPVPDAIVNLPSYWNDLVDNADIKKGRGAATWHLRIEKLKPGVCYAMFLFDKAGTAMRLFSNGKLITQIGIPAEDFKNTVSGRSMEIALLESDAEGSIDLVIHCSNYIYRKGGLWGNLEIAEESYVKRWYNHSFNQVLVFAGALTFIMLYNFLIFLFRKYDWASFHLSMVTFFILLRLVSAGFSLLLIYFPDIPFSIDYKTEYTALFAGPIFFILYVTYLHWNGSISILDKIGVSIGVLLGLCTWFLPLKLANWFVEPNQIFIFVSALVVLSRLFIYAKETSFGTIALTVLSILIIIFGGLHDTLAYQMIPIFLSNVNLVPYTFIIFAVFQSILIARQHQKTARSIGLLSNRLQKLNDAYSRFVPKEFLALLNKENIMEVDLGDWTAKNVTMLCADIRDFTSLSENLSSKETFDFLNSYLTQIAPLIRKYDGFIEKYLGDGIIAIFPNNTSSVFQCAIEMQQTIQSLRKNSTGRMQGLLRIGIGIHYGKVVLGTAGVKKRMAEVTVSQAVDTLIRLESLTKVFHVPILVSDIAVNVLQKNSAQNEGLQTFSFIFSKINTAALKHPLKEEIFSLDIPDA